MSYIRTPEHKKRMSEKLKRRKCPWIAKRNKEIKLSGAKNPNYKHGLTNGNKCIDCGKPIWFSFVRCKRCANKGSNNPRYIDGRTRFERSLRNLREYKAWKEEVLKRDEGICQKCGINEFIEVHHRISFSSICNEFIDAYNQLKLKEDKKGELVKWYYPLWDVDNGITLCVNCHKKIDEKRRSFL